MPDHSAHAGYAICVINLPAHLLHVYVGTTQLCRYVEWEEYENHELSVGALTVLPRKNKLKS